MIAAGLPTPKSLPPQVRTEIPDINDASGVESQFAGIGELHALINAVGIIRRDDEYKPDGFANVIDVNLTGRCAPVSRPIRNFSWGWFDCEFCFDV